MEKKSKHSAGIILCRLLTALGIVGNVISLISESNGLWVLNYCVSIALLVFIAYYVIYGYKKPHGNLLKYIILSYALLSLSLIPTHIQLENTGVIVLLAFQIGLVCYIAGRLAKAKENLILMILATICCVITAVAGIVSGNITIGVVIPFIIWVDICIAYFLRYKEHKEAGLTDAPKK